VEEKKEGKLRHEWYVPYAYNFLKIIFAPFFHWIWIEKVTGLDNLPKKSSAIIAFNHQSYFDFLCFIAACPRPIHFLSAEKFFSHWFWNPLMRMTGQIKVDRLSHDKQLTHARVYHHIKEGKLIGIFPEGSRAPDRNEMLKAFTGVSKYAITGQVPVIPVGIKGTHEVMSRFDRTPKFKKIISLHIGKPIKFEEHYGKIMSETDYQYFTDKIMLEIAALSGKKYPHFLTP
jgi:1-acyl-sn-glycerol-3-phosphate acyltransferase